MSNVTGALALTRKGAKEHNPLLTLARDHFDRNPATYPNAEAQLAHTIKRFSDALDELAGQMEEPGFPTFPHDDLFDEQAGLTHDQAMTLLLYYVDEILNLHVGNLAAAFEGWLKKECARR